MLKHYSTGILMFFWASGILWSATGCSRTPVATSTVKNTEVVSAASSPSTAVASAPASTAQPATVPAASNPYKLALEKADSAGNITLSAQSPDDWNLVASRWQQAIQLLRSVPNSSPYKALVQPKLAEYQRNLAYAKKQAARASSGDIAYDPGVLSVAPRTYSTADSQPANAISDSSPSDSTSSPGRVYRARIKRRAGGTPIIDVTFNSQRTFEMIVDTGASGTVITEQMAAALGVSVIGKAKVDTASDKGVEVPLTYLNSISVGGAVVKGVVVAIGNSALDVGLLGHDFFGDYDVTVKR